MKGSISTSKPFDIFFSGSCCWSLGGLEDVEVVYSLEVAETLEEDSLPSLAIFDPCCGSRIFFFEESRSYNVCLVVLFSGSLRLVESLATAHRSLHLYRGNYCFPAKYGNSWHLGAFCALENGYCFSPESRPSRPHVGFRLDHMSIRLICRKKGD